MDNEKILKELDGFYVKFHTKLYGKPYKILDTCDSDEIIDALRELDREIEKLDDTLEELIDEIENG